MRTQVWSLASLKGLSIWHCFKLQGRSQMQFRSGVVRAVMQACIDLTASVGTSICRRCSPTKKKKDPHTLGHVTALLEPFMISHLTQNRSWRPRSVSITQASVTWQPLFPSLSPHLLCSSVTNTTAHGNTGSLTHWVRPGIEDAISWMLVRFANCWATKGTVLVSFCKYTQQVIF